MARLKKSVIYFVRHGECLGNVTRQALPQAEDVLTEKGKLQAKLLGELIKNEDFTTAYASPFLRTIETAKTILSQSVASSSVPLKDDERLREKNLGIHEGKQFKEILAAIFKSGEKDFFEYDGDGVETKEEMEFRIDSFLQDIFNKVDSSEEPLKILTVTHAATLLHMWKYLPANPGKYLLTNWKPDYFKITPNTGYFKLTIQKSPSPGGPREMEILVAHGKEHLKTLGEDTLQSAASKEEEFKKYRGCVQQ